MGFTPTYKYVSDTVRKWGRTGIIKFPGAFKAQDTGYFFIYFDGCKDAVFKNSIMVLIQDYKSKSPSFWVDHNGNMDFSDDDQTPVKASNNSRVILKLKNFNNPEGEFHISFFKTDESDNTFLLNGFAKPGPTLNGNFREDLEYGFSDRRMNIKDFSGQIGNQKVRLAIYDYDCDGLFTKNNEDRLMIQYDPKKEFADQVTHGAVILKETTLLLIGGQQYELTEIEESGKYLILEPSSKPFNAPITVGQKLKDYKINMDGELVPLMNLLNNKEYILVDIWGSWCGGCTSQLPLLKRLDSTYSNSISIVGLNSGDSEEKMLNYIKKHDIKWPNGKLTVQIKSDLRIEAFPSYLLIDPSRKLVLYESIFEIEEYLKENIKSQNN